MLAEKAGQALQTELLRLNEYTRKIQVTQTYTNSLVGVVATPGHVIQVCFFYFYSEVPPYLPQSANRRLDSAPLGKMNHLD